ncbi:Uncharacterised protein [Mycobacteroides abscessus subsp. abscessus]|nr:Uncharacterised protein [Mycobacteroides abscessus subsp. abscessus]
MTARMMSGFDHDRMPGTARPHSNQAPLIAPAEVPYTASNTADNPSSSSPCTMPLEYTPRLPPPSITRTRR